MNHIMRTLLPNPVDGTCKSAIKAAIRCTMNKRTLCHTLTSTGFGDQTKSFGCTTVMTAAFIVGMPTAVARGDTSSGDTAILKKLMPMWEAHPNHCTRITRASRRMSNKPVEIVLLR